MSIGQRLKEERERLNCSQTRFAAIGGVTKHTQINYESDKSSPIAIYFENLSRVGLDVSYVITGIKQENTGLELLLDEEKKLLTAFRQCSPEIKAFLTESLIHGVQKGYAIRPL